jgi:hypothetical protein
VAERTWPSVIAWPVAAALFCALPAFRVKVCPSAPVTTCEVGTPPVRLELRQPS